MAHPMTKADLSLTLNERQHSLIQAMSGLSKRGLVVKSFSANANTQHPDIVLAFEPLQKQLPKGLKVLDNKVTGNSQGVRTRHKTALFMGCRVRWQEEV